MRPTGHALVYSENTAISSVTMRHALTMLHREVAIIREPAPGGETIGPFPVPESLDLIKAIDLAVFEHTGTVPYSKRALYVRDRGRCGYCNAVLSESEATMDHVVPKSRGGQALWDNAVLACFDCNQRKRNRTPEEAGMWLLKPLYAPTWLDVYAPTGRIG